MKYREQVDILTSNLCKMDPSDKLASNSTMEFMSALDTIPDCLPSSEYPGFRVTDDHFEQVLVGLKPPVIEVAFRPL